MVSTVTNDYGVASIQTDTFTSVELIAGDTPLIVTTTENVDSTVLAAGMVALRVVGLDAQGEVVDALYGTTQAVGILVSPIAAGSSAGTKALVYRAGCFNPAALSWPASYDTDEKKRTAFNAAVGSQIFIKKTPVA